MSKPSQALINEWEKILADEGLAEVSLFDNTGKPHSVNFISATSEGCNSDWYEHVNIAENGQVLRIEDLPDALVARKLSHDVASLPPSWPAGELKLLRAWSESGNFLGSCEAIGIPFNEGRKIRRRFEQFIRNQVQ